MSVDRATVLKVATLARLRLPEERVEPMVEELNGILNWVEQLAAVDTDGVEPMTSVVSHRLHWREDRVTDGDKRDAILSNAPDAEFGFFAVPKVIE